MCQIFREDSAGQEWAERLGLGRAGLEGFSAVSCFCDLLLVGGGKGKGKGKGKGVGSSTDSMHGTEGEESGCVSWADGKCRRGLDSGLVRGRELVRTGRRGATTGAGRFRSL